jgi:hypothetical protein
VLVGFIRKDSLSLPEFSDEEIVEGGEVLSFVLLHGNLEIPNKSVDFRAA